MAEVHLHFDVGSGGTWQWSLLKRNVWGDGAARPCSFPISQCHRRLDSALGHCWASPWAAWHLCLVPPPSLSELPNAILVAEPWCNHLHGNLPEEMGFTGNLWLHGRERGAGYSVGLVLSQCILHRPLTSAVCTYKLGFSSVLVPASLPCTGGSTWDSAGIWSPRGHHC